MRIFIFRLLLVAYLLFLGKLLFFTIGSIDRRIFYVLHDKEKKIHIVPFMNTYYSIRSVFNEENDHPDIFLHRLNVLKNIGGNLVLFLPLGLIGPLAFRRLCSALMMTKVALGLSFVIEVSQYSLRLGIFDIDDMIFNTAGAFAGYYILKTSTYLYALIISRMDFTCRS